MKNKPHVVIIDHYDSFTYILVVMLENLGATVTVFRTDADIEEVERARGTHIVLSPGPGHPKDVPLFEKVLRRFKSRVPILGVCLGHQAIGRYFGAVVDRYDLIVMHGKISKIRHDSTGIFHGLPNPMAVCRYHSLAILERTVDKVALRVVAHSDMDGVIMAVQCIEYPHVVGVQFHPESLFTEHGSGLLGNFLKMQVSDDTRWAFPSSRLKP